VTRRDVSKIVSFSEMKVKKKMFSSVVLTPERRGRPSLRRVARLSQALTQLDDDAFGG
jgi:hypothetical protein